MGYDMYWDRRPDDDSTGMARYAALNTEFDQLTEALGRLRTDEQQAEVERLYNAISDAEYWYFRLNIWSMGTAREELELVSVVYGDYEVEFPQSAEWNPGGDRPGIPVHKLCSNDGWHVLPGEITTGIGWADHHTPGWREDLTDFVAGFVTWMERAAREGNGFRVN